VITALEDPDPGLTDSHGAVVEAVHGASGDTVRAKLSPPAAGLTIAEELESVTSP
jgi:hypothetical protein